MTRPNRSEPEKNPRSPSSQRPQSGRESQVPREERSRGTSRGDEGGNRPEEGFDDEDES